MPGSVLCHQLIICVGEPVILMWSHSFSILYMPEHMSMLRRSWKTLIVESCPFTMVTIWETISKFPENWIIFISSDVNTIVRAFGRVLFWSCVILLNVGCCFCLLFPWSLCLYRAFRWNWYLLLPRASSWRTRQEWLICLTLHAHLCWWWNCRLLWFL